MSSLKGLIQIIDKDLSAEAFKFLLRLNPTYVKRVKLLASASHLSSSFKEEYKALRDEMQHSGILVELRILDERDSQDIHDRYLISDNAAYNTPPWNIINKKLGDVVRIENHSSKRAHFDKFWGRATDILKVPTK